MNHGGRVPGQAMSGDQSALSLLVNAAGSRDAPRGQRESNAAMSRSLTDTLRLRALAGDGGPSLEEQIFLQQQAQSAYGGQGNLGFLNQLRDHSVLLSQLGQQQQLASLLGLGGGSNQAQDVRQALAAAQLRQSQAAQHLTNADLLALTRSGALSGLSNIFGGGNFGAAGVQNVGYGQVGGYGGTVNQGNGFGEPGVQGLSSEIEGLQRLEELERRQRILGASAEARGSSPAVARVESSLPPAAASMNTEKPTEQQTLLRADASQSSKFKSAQSPVVECTPVPETTKEELEKTPGSVIVPCRARGMPMDHNFKTAFFVIPENVRHGEELICSYFACRNAGIKFRYCSHCKVPVAKRNFRKRHKHGGDIMVKGGDDDSVDEVPVKRGIPSQITASREEDEEADGISSQSADSTNLLDNKHESVDVVEQGRSLKEPDQPGLAAIPMAVAPEQPKDDRANGANDSAEVIIPCEKKISDMRKQRWISLLAKRPSTKDGDSMSGWLMEVLAVSDLETPLKVSENTEEDAKLKATKKREKSDEPQKRSEKIANDSHPSDSGDSTNDESVSNDNKKLKKEKDPPIAFNGGIVKKKRPSADLLRDGSEQKTKSGSYVRGSFAEWKERKKQKKQSKSGNNSTQQDAT